MLFADSAGYRIETMKPTLCIVAAGCLLLSGCSGCNRPTADLRVQPVKKKDDKELARELFQNANDPPQFRDANDRLNQFLANNPEVVARLDPAVKDKAAMQEVLRKKQPGIDVDKLDEHALHEKFLEAVVGLDKAEIREVESSSLTLLDAHYLEGCNLLREVEHSLMLQGLPPLEQAQRCFDWVMRHVVLQEGRSALLPPQYVLKRGQGSAAERAFVVLSLLQQVTSGPQRLDGCVIALPDKQGQPRPWLVGVLIASKDAPEIYVFDPRLGMAVPLPKGGGIATLAQLRSDPAVVEGLNFAGARDQDKVDPAKVANAEILLACPLSSLSARMRYLEEDLLAAVDPIRVAIRPADLIKRFENCNAGTVRIWNGTQPKADVPTPAQTRALRELLPTEEGGNDNTKEKGRQRLDLFRYQLVPTVAIAKGFADEGLGIADLRVARAEEILNLMGQQLWGDYSFAPAQDLTRGRLDACRKRLARISAILDGVAGRAVNSSAIAKWRERVREAYGSNDDYKIAEIWSEDQWLSQLLSNPDEDVAGARARPGAGGDNLPADADSKGFAKKILSEIVLRAVLEPVHARCDYLLALQWQEKAERLDEQAFKKERLSAFDNADYWWVKYVAGNPLTVESVRERFGAVKAQIQGNRRQMAVGLLEYHGKTLREIATARVLHARTLLLKGKRENAAVVLQQLVNDLTNLDADAEHNGRNGRR